MPATSRSEEVASRINPEATRGQPPRPFGSHIPTHSSLQETTSGQVVPIIGNHNEICKTVHKLLQKQVPEQPTWTPPSRDYMNKPVMCQVCHYSVNDVESVFLCDACEHAYHFRCLPSSNQKAVPRGEWHCPKCLLLSNGKPLPPKYGRVTRNVTASKASSKVAGFQTSSVQKANVQKSRTVNPQVVTTGSVPNSIKAPDMREVQGSTNSKSYSEAYSMKNSNQSGVIGGPVGGATNVISGEDLNASSLQGPSMADTKPSSVVKMIHVANSVTGEQPSSGISTGDHSANPYNGVSNSSGNDLVVLDISQQSSDNMPNSVAKQPESDTIMPDKGLDNTTSSNLMETTVTETETYDLKRDNNVSSSLQDENSIPLPGINTTSGIEDNLSGLCHDQAGDPVNEDK